ncbi:hypothetical protein MMC28_005129 [Mycoblastus sanguinarius]|nr:hypothetical protein [Mycoblastus sanguinarius]
MARYARLHGSQDATVERRESTRRPNPVVPALKNRRFSSVSQLTVYVFAAKYLADRHLQEFNYTMKQVRRWLQARLASPDRGFVTKEASKQLNIHLGKSEYEQQHPKLSEGIALGEEALWVLSQLDLERNAARAEQGSPERVADWWTGGRGEKGKGKAKRKYKSKKASKQGEVGVEGLGAGLSGFGLGEEADDMDEGGVELDEQKFGEEGEGEGENEDEEFEGAEGLVSMSPEGSVVGEDEEL